MTKIPAIYIVLGDACGIGPELVAKSLAHAEDFEGVKALIVGSREVFDLGRRIAGAGGDLPTFGDVSEALASGARTVFVDHPDAEIGEITLGENNAEAGRADLALARYGAELHQRGLVDGLVWGPVNKKSLSMGGSPFEGYKAIVEDALGSTATSVEINTLGYLWTTRVTSHIAIADIPKAITKERILATLGYFDRELRGFGYTDPKIAVSGLNPHNGDGGMFGREEIDVIEPAIETAKRQGINADGPFPADTIFVKAKGGAIPGVVCMYHDQCQIATKLLGFDEGVTYFGGMSLPIATPAHGTAFDIAGKGVANVKPFLNAIELIKKILLARHGKE